MAVGKVRGNRYSKQLAIMSFYTSVVLCILLYLLDSIGDPDPLDGGTFVFFFIIIILCQLFTFLVNLLPHRLSDISIAIIGAITGVVISTILGYLVIVYEVQI